MTPEQRAALQRAAIRRAQTDSMGFPVTPAGGSSVDQQALAEFQPKLNAMTETGIMAAHNAAYAGFGDEFAGAKGAVFGHNVGDDGRLSMDYSGSMGDRYTRERDKYRETLGELTEENPGTAIVGSIGGGAIPGIMAAPLATGNSLLRTIGRGAGLGALGGGLAGAGYADGENVARNAAIGTGAGALVGGLAPAVVAGGAAAKNAAKDPVTGIIDAMLNRANTGKANRALQNTVGASKQTPDQLGQAVMRAAQEGQPEYRLMDAMGVPGARRASGIARAGGDSGTEIAEFLGRRQSGQAERVGSYVEDAFGFRGTGPSGNTLPIDPRNPIPDRPADILRNPQRSASNLSDNLTTARGQAADQAYDAARGNAAPVDIRGALGVIDNRIGGMQGSGVAGDGIDGKLAGYRSRLAAQPGPDGVSRELSDFDRVLGVKQSVQDDIGAAVRAGRNNEARELGKLMSELDQALEQSSDMYRTANDGFREASRVIESVDEGAGMSARGRAADNVSQFEAMNPDQQGAARIGYGDDLLARIERNTSPTANKAKVLQSPKRDQEAAAIALQPDVYGRRLTRETDMWETQNRALGGSRTADNIEDIEQTGEIAAGVGGAVRSAANFQLGDTAVKIASLLKPIATGQNEATRQLIAKALMSNDPQKALAPMLRQKGQSDSTRRLIEALVRSAGRQGVNEQKGSDSRQQ